MLQELSLVSDALGVTGTSWSIEQCAACTMHDRGACFVSGMHLVPLIPLSSQPKCTTAPDAGLPRLTLSS